jgi:uncharacterized protein (TIGR02594 family)
VTSEFLALPGVIDPSDPGKGSLILPVEDPRVVRAANFLARVPSDKPPIEVVKYMIRELPEGERMEWPRDTPDNRRPANPIIIAFFAATRTEPFQGDQTAWCAAIACWALQRAGLPHPRSAGSRAFRTYGEETRDPRPGDVACFINKRDPIQGHVGFFNGFTDATRQRIQLVGGNQSDRISDLPWPLDGRDLRLHSYRTAPGLRSA